MQVTDNLEFISCNFFFLDLKLYLQIYNYEFMINYGGNRIYFNLINLTVNCIQNFSIITVNLLVMTLEIRPLAAIYHPKCSLSVVAVGGMLMPTGFAHLSIA